MTANTPTFHMKYPETTSSFDHGSALLKRKVPRLTLSTDVKTFSNCHSHTNPSLTPLFAQVPHSSSGVLSRMEVDEATLHQNNIAKTARSLRLKRSLGEHMDSGYDSERCSLDSIYPAPLPTSFIDNTTTTCTVALPLSGRQSPSYPQQMQDTRFHKPHHPRLQPSSFYPSPPQSTVASPLEVSNPLPLPIQPSPSLPLHQPRPSRRIPIVSLSRLASAAEKMENSTLRRANMHRDHLDAMSRNVYPSNYRRSPYSRADRNKQIGAVPREDSTTRRFVQCSCGCMESYVVG